MKYMLLVYLDENSLNSIERDACYRESADFARELAARGSYRGAAPLEPTTTATTVRVQRAGRMVTDGPFAETREQLGGYYLIEAPHLDAAIEIAGRVPAAKFGCVEIRPVLEIPGLPDE
jgi:hypothetical protein